MNWTCGRSWTRDLPTFEPTGLQRVVVLAANRREELTAAIVALGLDSDAVLPGLPDSGIAEYEAELVERLEVLLADADCVILPWPGDPHPDHAAVGRAGLAAAPVQAHRWSYPVWMWHWMGTDDPAIPWRHAPGTPQPRTRHSATGQSCTS